MTKMQLEIELCELQVLIMNTTMFLETHKFMSDKAAIVHEKELTKLLDEKNKIIGILTTEYEVDRDDIF